MLGILKAGFGSSEARQIERAKRSEAKQLERAAIAREAAGTNLAYEQRKVGERVQSDAIAVMAASGGVVDSDFVADIKSTTDYNVLSELFASKTESSSLRLQAQKRRSEGARAKRVANTKLLTSIVVGGAKMYMGSTGAPITGAPITGAPIATGVNLNYNRYESHA